MFFFTKILSLVRDSQLLLPYDLPVIDSASQLVMSTSHQNRLDSSFMRPATITWALEDFASICSSKENSPSFKSQDNPEIHFDLHMSHKVPIQSFCYKEYVIIVLRLRKCSQAQADQLSVRYHISIINAKGEHCFSRGILH